MKMTRRDFLKLSSAAAAACGVTLLPAQKADAASAIQTLLEEAYLYAFPLVLVDATKTVSTNTKTASASRAPVNQFIHARKLLDASSRTVVSPNVDTIYTQAWLDVSAEPQIYVVPEADRFFQRAGTGRMDEHRRRAGSTRGLRHRLLELGGHAARGRPAHRHSHPDGLDHRPHHALRAGRPAERGGASGPDAANAPLGLPAGLAAAPEGSYSPENDFVPVQKVLAMTPQEFFDTANRLMETDPPAEADAPLLRSLAALSVGPGQQFDASALGPLGGLRWKRLLLQLKSSLRAQAARYSRQMGQWIYYGDPIGNFGTAYDYRTMVALMGLGANTTDIAIYPRTSTDSAGADLTGQKTYTLHFDALPPTVGNGFWSVTAYGEDNFLIDNPISRYCVNDRSGLHRNADGSVDVTLSKDAPEDTTNWLPVSDEKFHLFLRIYKPDWTALDSFRRRSSL